MSRMDQILKMLEREPNDVFLNFGLAMEFVKANRLEDAVVQFQKVIDLDGDYTAAWFQKGNTLVTLGRLHEASAVLRAGIEVAERIGNQHAASEMGEVLATLG